jgi:hypothetical protein
MRIEDGPVRQVLQTTQQRVDSRVSAGKKTVHLLKTGPREKSSFQGD